MSSLTSRHHPVHPPSADQSCFSYRASSAALLCLQVGQWGTCPPLGMALTISQPLCLPCCPPSPVSGTVSHVALVHACRWIASGQAWFTCETCLSTPVVMESAVLPCLLESQERVCQKRCRVCDICLKKSGILVCRYCSNKISQPGWLTNSRN